MPRHFGHHVNAVRDGLLAWIESVRWPEAGWGRWKYNAHMVRDYGLIPSGIAVKLLHALEALAAVPAAQRQEAIAFLQSTQDLADGYFKDPLVRDTDLVPNPHHSWEDIWGQMSVGGDALRLLGGAPRHALPQAAFADLRQVDVRQWVLGLGWRNPWLVGERFFRALRAYVFAGPGPERAATDPVVLAAFAALEREVFDPSTGMPSRLGCTSPAVAMAGLFKVMYAYLDVGRPLPFPAAAIDSTLALQRPDGEFGAGGDMCINWDAVWVLRNLDRQLRGGHRHAEIAAAGEALAAALRARFLKADGGFAFCGDRCLAVHHSVRLSDPFPEGDMLGTMMCLNCLQYADGWQSQARPEPLPLSPTPRDHAAV
jgi:hypothetical protein